MKKLTYLLCLMAAFLLSCRNLENPNQEEPVTEKNAPARFVPYQKYNVTVPEGTCSIVYLGDTKVATCYKSGTIMVPKLQASSKAENYRIVNIAGEFDPNINSENDLEMVVAFEDTKDGDHDYNDLVFQSKIHVWNYSDNTGKISMEITPVALGATKKLGMGVVLTDVDGKTIKDEVLYSDCRHEMFNDEQGFVNTQSTKINFDPLTENLTFQCTSSVIGVTWYLLVGDEKLYASSNYKASVDNDELPQGLVLMNIRDNIYHFTSGGTEYYCGHDFWQYPMEWIDIQTVYPDFNKQFLEHGDFKCLADPVGSFYDAIGADANLVVNDDDCLYTLYSNNIKPSVVGVQLWTNGPLWADRNVGAANPENWGDFFDWGNLIGYPCEGETCEHEFTDKKYWSTTGGTLTGDFVSGNSDYDAARFRLGGGWRMPTSVEINDLINKTTQEQVSNYNGTGVGGVKFISKSDPTKFIFIPNAGVVDQTGTKARGEAGCNWSCTIYPFSSAEGRALRSSDKGYLRSYGRDKGLTIRAICNPE